MKNCSITNHFNNHGYKYHAFKNGPANVLGVSPENGFCALCKNILIIYLRHAHFYPTGGAYFFSFNILVIGYLLFVSNKQAPKSESQSQIKYKVICNSMSIWSE